MKNKLIFISSLLINLTLVTPSFSQDAYIIQAEKSKINVSVRYLVTSRLVGNFTNFKGTIKYDSKNILKTDIDLTIKTKSIQTKKPSLGRLIRSKRLLDVKKYPRIYFESTRVSQKDDKYYIEGILDLHGIKKEVSFTFNIKNINSRFLKSTGSCRLNRKDFKVVWSKIFDKGGIIVRNSILIEWEIFAVKAQNIKGSKNQRVREDTH